MIRYQVALILSLAILPTVASAQERRSHDHRGTAQQQRACRSDVLRHCRNTQDQDDATIAECLKAHVQQLSPDCRRVLEDGG
jgi:cysteine rich repeat protein